MSDLKHLLTLAQLDRPTLDKLLDSADAFKAKRGTPEAETPLAGKTVALIFTKSSTRTRVSFEVGIHELGGNSMFLDPSAIQIGRGESMADTAKVMSRYVHGIIIRCHGHQDLVDYASHSDIPVINALTDSFHPCQLLADLQAIRELKGKTDGIKVAYVGDGASNMGRSWAIAAKLAGMDLRIGAPEAFKLKMNF